MLPELITLAIAIGFLYGLHQLIEAIRNSKSNRENSLLDNLRFDPAQHELTVWLTDGSTITGTPDPSGIKSLKHGIILTNARMNGNEGAPSPLTYIPGSNIAAIGTATRHQQQET